ncbi:hypothetical protein OS189_01505 [Sulfitobacter sp. F26169L]|uniref:hypothetical protein n=1 Tax=Sulfitobacter sp. F26169L TaxID=2996015 RepID=UPI0022608FB6|nr:hypothetical protein [Sulfitobacter sp. F26169L]MCX7565017.1 hypothetical protein [Sulfitobacter sp. F26169L]
MTQIITGPFGRMAYYDGHATTGGQYPALDLPDTTFARGESLTAANDSVALQVIQLPRQMRSRAALAMFGTPAKREN